jgi:hypothetical protein
MVATKLRVEWCQWGLLALLVLVLNVAACGSDSSSPTAPSRTGAQATLQSLTVVGSSPGGGVVLHRDETATATVTLSGSAPAGGAAVALTVSGAESRVLIVPATVTIPAGSSSAAFPVTVASSGVSSPTEVTLNAVYRDVRQSFLIRLEPLR